MWATPSSGRMRHVFRGMTQMGFFNVFLFEIISHFKLMLKLFRNQ